MSKQIQKFRNTFLLPTSPETVWLCHLIPKVCGSCFTTGNCDPMTLITIEWTLGSSPLVDLEKFEFDVLSLARHPNFLANTTVDQRLFITGQKKVQCGKQKIFVLF